MKAYSESIVDGKISERERSLLVTLASAYGIDEDRVREIEASFSDENSESIIEDVKIQLNDGSRIVGKNAKNHNINGMLTISTKIEEFENISIIAKNYKNIWYSLGIHPHNVNNNYKDLQRAITEFKSDKKFIGIGETGLDYFYENSSKKLQIDSFINHIELSRSPDLPIIIHPRDADRDTISIL